MGQDILFIPKGSGGSFLLHLHIALGIYERRPHAHSHFTIGLFGMGQQSTIKAFKALVQIYPHPQRLPFAG